MQARRPILDGRCLYNAVWFKALAFAVAVQICCGVRLLDKRDGIPNGGRRYDIWAPPNSGSGCDTARHEAFVQNTIRSICCGIRCVVAHAPQGGDHPSHGDLQISLQETLVVVSAISSVKTISVIMQWRSMGLLTST